MSEFAVGEGAARRSMLWTLGRIVGPVALIPACSAVDAGTSETTLQPEAQVILTEWQEENQYFGEPCTGDRVLEGTIKGEDGSPVAAQIGFDFGNAEGVSIDQDGSPKDGPYSEVLLLNLLNRPDDDLTTWCVNVPKDAQTASVETYTRRIYDQDGNLANRSDEYGHSMNHSVVIGPDGANIDLVLPQVCGFGSEDVANTGAVELWAVVNGEPQDPWRTVAWSRHRDDDTQIAGFGALNINLPNMPQARLIERLEPQTYQLKTHVREADADDQYVVQLETTVEPCETTQQSIEITDIDGVVACTANAFTDSGLVDQDCSVEKRPYDPLA